MKRFLPLALIIVVFTSGCTGLDGILSMIPFIGGDTVEQYEHDVLIIQSMEVVPNEIDSGQTALVNAYIKNVGDKTVGMVDGVGSRVKVDLYDYCEGLFTPRVLTCGDMQIPVTVDNQGNTKCEIENIIPGEIVPVIWSVCQNRAPPVKVKTICPADGLKMSVVYEYDTNSVTTLGLISLSEMQREMIEREYVPTSSYINLGQGPIKAYLTVEDKQPVPVYDVLPGTDFTDKDVLNARTVLKLQLKNMGSGRLASTVQVPMEGGGTREVIGIKGSSITVDGVSMKEIEEKLGDLHPVSDKEQDCPFEATTWKEKPVRFVGDESSPFYCKIDLAELKGDVTTRTSRLITTNIKYTYMVTKSAMIVVNPKIVD